ncbi:tyrosinase-like [Heptranchias perlo]|uniref:tyrosinase-like n=1 Tax=Heptranchias perlo TaxID=212740 RepID=UPI00355972E6
MWWLLLPLAFVSGAGAQFPRACTQPGALKAKICCPIWEQDGSACGGKSSRGSCEAPNDIWSPEPSRRDFRTAWPSSFFSRICVCTGNFAGFDCGECKEGYRGADCQRWVVTVRLGVHEMDQAARSRFIDQLLLAKNTVSERYMVLTSPRTSDVNSYSFHNATVYDVCTWVHYIAAKPVKTRLDPNFAHMGAAFPVWHRKYLAFFESEIRLLTKDEDFFVPYWNWTREVDCDVCTDEFLGANDPNGVLLHPSRFANWELQLQAPATGCRCGTGSDFYSSSSHRERLGQGYECPLLQILCTYDGDEDDNFEVICPNPKGKITLLSRNPGKNFRARRLPTAQDVSKVLQLKYYDSFPYNQYAPFSFRNSLEGFKDPNHPGRSTIALHNLVHIYLNGTISQVPSASNDPIFMLHHAFIDK